MAIPRPTLADIDLPPRRRLRDGSRTLSRSSSVSSTSAPIRIVRARGGRGRSVSTLSTLSSTTSGSGISRRSGLRTRANAGPEHAPEYEVNHDDEVNYETGGRVDRGSTLIDMLNDIDPPAIDATSSTSSNDAEALANRRYTAAEKGKGRAGRAGRARETIEIDDDEEEDSIQITGVKRKTEMESEEEVVEDGDEDEDATRLGAYTCPVCFSEPTNAVVTTCGHILCSECLFSCMIAAINRNPNPNQFPTAPKPKPKRGKKTKKRKPELQPTEWTATTLQETWQFNRDLRYEEAARESGMDENSIEAGRDTSEVSVQMMTKGLWKVEGSYWIVEGDCPVCRKGLPGGYGPSEKGIGSVIPVEISVGVGYKA